MTHEYRQYLKQEVDRVQRRRRMLDNMIRQELRPFGKNIRRNMRRVAARAANG